MLVHHLPPTGKFPGLVRTLVACIARQFSQDPVAWAVAQTDFI